MDLCQVGLATGADVDDVLCDGAVPIKGSHPGQHLTPLRVVGDGNIEWSIRHLCVQEEGSRYDKGTMMTITVSSVVQCIENMTVIPFASYLFLLLLLRLSVNIFDYLLAFNW